MTVSVYLRVVFDLVFHVRHCYLSHRGAAEVPRCVNAVQKDGQGIFYMYAS
jgi:hypothetical protein